MKNYSLRPLTSAEYETESLAIALAQTLIEVRNLIEGYVDIKDNPNGGQPLPNNAMRAVKFIDGALRVAEDWERRREEDYKAIMAEQAAEEGRQ
jgi:hypothetical protein